MILRRRMILAGLASAILQPALVRAQAGPSVPRIAIAVWGSQASESHRVAGLIAGLAELGWKDGVTMQVNIGWGESNSARYRSVVAELVAKKPSVLLVSRDAEALIALPLTGSLPILFASGFDPVGIGLVTSLANPGGMVTGVSIQNREFSPKRLSLLTEAVPRLARVGALYRPMDENAVHWLKITTEQGKGRGVQVVPVPIDRREDLVPAFAALAKQKTGAILNIPDRLFFEMRKDLADLSLKHGLAAIGGVQEFADSGALLSYAPDVISAWRRLATFVDRILKGAVPAKMPVEQLNVFELVVNLRTAKALKIQIPASLLLQATRVIE